MDILKLEHQVISQSYHSLILVNSQTFPILRSDKFTLKTLVIPRGNLVVETRRAGSCFPLPGAPSSDAKHETAKVISVTDLLYDDPNVPYTPLPEHNLDESMLPHHSYKAGLFLLQAAS